MSVEEIQKTLKIVKREVAGASRYFKDGYLVDALLVVRRSMASLQQVYDTLIKFQD